MHRLRPRRWSRGAGGAQPWRGVAGEGAGVEAAGAGGSATTRREQTPGKGGLPPLLLFSFTLRRWGQPEICVLVVHLCWGSSGASMTGSGASMAGSVSSPTGYLESHDPLVRRRLR